MANNDDLLGRIEALKEGLIRALQNALDAGLALLQEQVQALYPSSSFTEYSETTDDYIIKGLATGDKRVIYSEEGTVPHLIVPVRAKALRFIVGNRVVFAKHVHHPGFAGQHLIDDTISNSQDYIVENLQSEIDKAVKGAGL